MIIQGAKGFALITFMLSSTLPLCSEKQSNYRSQKTSINPLFCLGHRLLHEHPEKPRVTKPVELMALCWLWILSRFSVSLI